MANRSEESSKEQKFHEVAVALASLLNTVGPLKISHSQIAKKSAVSRAWIYKYIGANHDDLISFAIEHLGKKVTETDRLEPVNSKDELINHITNGVERMLDNTERYPWLLPVYYRYRGTQTKPGLLIDAIEQDYVKRQTQNILRNLPSLDEKRAVIAAEILTMFRIGIAFSWQRGDISKKANKKELLESVRTWFEQLLLN